MKLFYAEGQNNTFKTIKDMLKVRNTQDTSISGKM